MPRNARNHDVCLNWRRAAVLVAALVAARTTADAIAQEPVTGSEQYAAEREEYAGQQRKKVQQARDINENLSATIQPLNGEQEDAFEDVLRNGTRPGAPDFQALTDGLRWEIYKATNPELKTDQTRFQAIKNRLQSALFYRAGQGIAGRKEKEDFRRVLCTEALKLLKDLLKNNFQARSLAVELLPALETVADRKQRRILDAAADALVEVLADEQQPDAIKLRAAESIATYLENVTPSAQIEIKFAMAIGKELESSVTADGYQLHMIDALSRIRAPRQVIGVNQTAVVIEILVSVLQDKKREPVVRCSAAGALGSVGIDPRIDLEPLAWKVVQLAAEMGASYNQNPKYPFWAKSSLELFLAFHHKVAPAAGKPLQNGMLNRRPRSERIRDAYKQVLPICLAILDRPAKIDPALVTAAAAWVEANQPNNLHFDAGSTPVKP